MIDLNVVVVISLVILAIFSVFILIVLIPISLQLSRTLNSAQFLLDTINDDLEPTVKEISQSITGVKKVVQKSTTAFKLGMDEAGIILISSAYGIMAGLKDYLSASKSSKTSYNGKGRTQLKASVEQEKG